MSPLFTIGRRRPRREEPQAEAAFPTAGDAATADLGAPADDPIAPPLDKEPPPPEPPAAQPAQMAAADEAPTDMAASLEAATTMAATADDAPPPPRLDLADFCADELLLQRRHRALIEAWRWYDTPAERLRLAREYPSLCPASVSPWTWYLVRPVVLRWWYGARAALLPALLLGPVSVIAFEWATGRPAPVLLPFVVGLGCSHLLWVGEYLEALGRARRTGLLQAMIFTGRPLRVFADEIGHTASLLVRDVPLATALTGTGTIALFHGVTIIEQFVLAVLLGLLLVGATKRALGRRRLRRAGEALCADDTPPDQRRRALEHLRSLRPTAGRSADGASSRYVLLLIGLSISRRLAPESRLLSGLLVFAWIPLLPLLLLVAALPLYATGLVVLGGTVMPAVKVAGSGPQVMLLIGSLLVGLIVVIELLLWVGRRFFPLESVVAELGEWP